MHGPRHVVLAPMVGTFIMLLFVLFPILWRNFLPGFVFLLLDSIAFILFVLVFLTLLLFVSFVCLGGQLGRQLELSFELVDGGCHGHDFIVVDGLGSPGTLVS